MKIINQGIINRVSPFLHADYSSFYVDPTLSYLQIIFVFLAIVFITGIILLPAIIDYFLNKRFLD